MKIFIKPALLALVGALLLGTTPAAQAQVRVNVGIGIPAWGPQVGSNTQYYYIPELDAYYDLYNQWYLFFDGYNWVTSYTLPPAYQGFDPYAFHPVPLPYVGPQPWAYVQRYPQRFAPYRRYYQQPRVVVVQPSRNGYYRGGYGTYNNYPGGRGGYSAPVVVQQPRYDRDDRRGGYNSGYGNDRNDRRGGGYDQGDNRGSYPQNGNQGNGRGSQNNQGNDGGRRSGHDNNGRGRF